MRSSVCRPPGKTKTRNFSHGSKHIFFEILSIDLILNHDWRFLYALSSLNLLPFHVLKQSSEGFLGHLKILLLTMPNIQGCFEGALTDPCADAPWALEVPEPLQRECIDILSILEVGRIDKNACDCGWHIP